uniref:Nucleotide-diphospho-sugar transferase domain-containing protein n=1 Tax=Alexandrium catenella TaxID=2925 RepID=A0A7S1LTH9_ALECA|mmetsp:Transcript_1233/g.3341  ORF Transcript_1233/g.3341 Transcript_1233/m.3341 type:complete len:548 (+) Transcript_1233:163-1806(+)
MEAHPRTAGVHDAGHSTTAEASNTVCLFDPRGDLLTLGSRALEEFSEYGDIARVDLSLVVVMNCALLTYFDVRSAQQVLLRYAGRAEPFAPLAHDCRIVRVRVGAFFERLPVLAATGGFGQFGKVAHVSMSGGDALVEYFDMRAAQRLLSVAGNTASPLLLNNQPQQPPSANMSLILANMGRRADLAGMGNVLGKGLEAGMAGSNPLTPAPAPAPVPVPPPAKMLPPKPAPLAKKKCPGLPLGFNVVHRAHPVVQAEPERYQIVEHKDAPELARRIARPDPYKDLIFTTWQGGNIFTRFWFSHLRSVGLEDHTLMITYDQKDCHTFPVKNCVVQKVDDMLRVMKETKVPPNNGGLIHGAGLAVVSKWTWSLEFAKAGYNVLFADNDAVFVQNPFDYWWRPEVKKYDIMGLSDWRTKGGEVGYCRRNIHDINCQSTGIMFFRSNSRTIASITEMVKEATPPGRAWEQALWQKFIPRIAQIHKGTYQLLPLKYFMNLEWVEKRNPDAVAVHMGYVHGMCNKIHAFWCVGLGVEGLERDVEVPCRGAAIW